MAFQQFPAKGGIPSGNTAGRPSNPVVGDTYYNGQLEILEIYNGTTWVANSAPPATPSITSVTDASTGDAYTSTAGKLTVVLAQGSGGGTPGQYNVYTTAGGFSASSSTSTVTITGLTPGTAYTIYGNAQNNFGTTVNTANAAAVTPTTRPGVPTAVTVSPGSAGRINASWTAGATGGKSVTYTITPYLNGTTAQTSSTTTSTSLSITTGISAGNSYTFKVKATNDNGDSPDSTASSSVTPASAPSSVDFLVVAGGGSGGYVSSGGGGGAGGYKTSASSSGGPSAALSKVSITAGTAYTVTVGAGAAASPTGDNGLNGNNSVFATQTSTGGGYGATYQSSSTNGGPGGNGGSGGGAAGNGASGLYSGGSGTANQGNNGGANGNLPYYGGAGGGAGAAGGNQGAQGGAGLNNSLGGTSIGYAGGGSSYNSAANAFGGGAGAPNGGTKSGTVNTGGGGGVWDGSGTAVNAGGSGIVIISYATTNSDPDTISAGLTYTRTVYGSDVCYKFTAGTGTVTW